jgi:hypothetical protein
MVLTCGDILYLTLANACLWRIRRSGAHHGVSKAGLEPIAYTGVMALSRSFMFGSAR